VKVYTMAEVMSIQVIPITLVTLIGWIRYNKQSGNLLESKPFTFMLFNSLFLWVCKLSVSIFLLNGVDITKEWSLY